MIVLAVVEIQRMQYTDHNTPLGYHTDQGPCGYSQYDNQGLYCGLSTPGRGVMPKPQNILRWNKNICLFVETV